MSEQYSELLTPETPDIVIKPFRRVPLDEKQVDEYACEIAVLRNVQYVCGGENVSQEELSEVLGRELGQPLPGTEGKFYKYLLDSGYELKDVAMPTPLDESLLLDLSNYPNHSLEVGSAFVGENVTSLLKDGYIVALTIGVEEGTPHAVLVTESLERTYSPDNAQTYYKVYDPSGSDFGDSCLSSQFDFHLEDPAQGNQIVTGIRPLEVPTK